MENVSFTARRLDDAPPLTVEVTALTRQRLDELDRLRNIGMDKAGALDRAGQAVLPSPDLTLERRFKLAARNVTEFDRIVRAVRHIMALEFELLGLFEGPDRDAVPEPAKPRPEAGPQAKPGFNLDGLDLRSDYRSGPLEDVVAGIRKALDVAPPPNDPFAPRPERKPREAAPDAPHQPASPPSKPPPATVEVPEETESRSALRAVLLALSAALGDGFGLPPAEPGTANPDPDPPPNRRNRGPPE